MAEKEMKLSDVLKKEGGNKGFLSVELPNLVLNCAIRYEKMGDKDIKEQHKPVYRDEKGREVVAKMIGEKKVKEWRVKVKDGVGDPAEGEVLPYQKINGKEKVVKPFPKSETIKIIKVAPREYKDNFLVNRTIEIWAEDQGGLYKLAEYLDTNKQVGLCQVVLREGYDQYLGIIEPRFVQDGKFGILMTLTQKQIVFNHLLDANAQFVEKDQAVGLELLEGVLT